MRALLLILVSLPAAALPPVTEEEAIAFHRAGLCSMAEPGQGLTARRGWIGAYYPGRMKLIGAHFDTGSDSVDATPGRVYFIEVTGGLVQWCPRFVMPGRDPCGDVPKAFLYDVKK